MEHDTDIQSPTVAIVGGGLTGGLAALGFAQKGWHTVHIAPAPAHTDRRSTALLSPSLAFLEELDLLTALEGKGAPLRIMRLLDGTRRLLRTPPTDFVASEAGLDAFGTNFLNADILDAITEASAGLENLERIDRPAESADVGAQPSITLSDGTQIRADLIVAGDGRNSIIRQAAGIDVRKWSYPQVAMVGEFTHSRDHGFVSTEFHTTSGPFTTVPMPGKRSSLVWVAEPTDADTIMALDMDAAARKIERRLQSSLGRVQLERPLQAFPLEGMIAKSFASQGALLVGEASHVFPPIGAQGLNLGIRDVKDALNAAGSPQTLNQTDRDSVCAAFNRSRAADVRLRTAGVDALNRSLLTEALPVQLARGVGLHALSSSSLLRRGAMAVGLGARKRRA
ncbi:MAG: FAD-dependent monooxygenase [Pseudomonadota bacterium]